MESLLIHPESTEQLKTIKAVLKALKVQFELHVEQPKLPSHVLEGLDKGLQQFEEGKSISLEEFSNKHLK